jgi:PiT family inorganic phosphate transporter
MSLVGILAGLSLFENSISNYTFVFRVIGMWFLAPLISIGLAFLIIRLLRKGWPKNFWQRILAYKMLLIILSFTTAFVLGANTLGLLVATGGFDLITVSASIIGIFVGSIFFSSGALKRISQEFYSLRYVNSLTSLIASTILVETATFINIPLSNTQTTASAIFGTGISYGTKFISAKPFLIIVASWIVVPLLSFIIGIILNILVIA